MFLVATLVDARLVPLSPNIFDEWRAGYHVRDVVRQQESLEDQIARYTWEGAFPKAGRTLEEKISEANAFLDRELAIEEQRGVGVSGAIVYQDKVLLSKGYGLSESDDPSSQVTSRTLFQIGSVSKTFISFGIAIMVEEGKLSWGDPVKKRLPSFKLFDKYAEEYVTIGDLCAMNSGLNDLPDVGRFFGVYPTDEDLVAGLANIEPAHTLRGGHDYANSNFAILGQVIKSVSGQPWDVYLKERIWDPLGMTRTFASAFDALGENDTSYGHFQCGEDLLGPYDLVEAPEAQLAGHGQGHKIASGSTLSSSDDLATLLRLILNKGTVDGVTILKDPAAVTSMITGKYTVNKEFMDEFLIEGHQYNPDGNTLASGYGFDYVGHGQWGHVYVDKSGDTTVHVTRTGIAPDAQLGVVFMSNTQTPGGHLSYPLDHIRSYVMGVFLDVPQDILDFAYHEWRKNDKLVPIFEGIPACGLRFWKNPPYRSLSFVARSAMVGKYVAQSSNGYFGSLEVREEQGELVLEYGALSAPLKYYTDKEHKRFFVWDYKASPLLIEATKSEGKFELEIGVVFRQE
ncbi:Enoyl-CoA hydratase [Phytophthora cinnamomi]|uniref:Enoyl-CoA hydratase n=1 Tax=Phytophthora cinnamomi TaxID=4785 RepID=UPI00355AA304|nr:Enoyl-CoA hydratase [Phytophthora cinnamomi]